MSEFTSEPPTQDLKPTQGEEANLPRDRHWAIMVSLYPDDFSEVEHQEAQDVLTQEGLDTDVHAWPLSQVRSAQERPYTSNNQAPVLSDHARSTLMEAASAAVERQRVTAEAMRDASGFGARFERWFAPLFGKTQALVWTAVVGLALIGLWNYQNELDSAPSLSDLPVIAPEESDSTELFNQGKLAPAKGEAPLDLGHKTEQELSSDAIDQDEMKEASDIDVKTTQIASVEEKSALNLSDEVELPYPTVDTQKPARTARRQPQSRAARKRKVRAKKSRRKSTQTRRMRKSKRSTPRLRKPAKRSRATLDSAPSKSRRAAYAPPPPEPSASTPSPSQATSDQVSSSFSESNNARPTAKGSGMFGRARLSTSGRTSSTRSASRSGTKKLSRGQIQRVIRREQRRLKACDSLFEGRVTVRWTIMASGKVKQVSVQSQPRSSALVQCFTSEIEQWRFPTSSAPQQVTHTFRHRSPQRLNAQESKSQPF